MEERKIKAIIVDDEPGCVSNLQYYLEKYCPKIEIVATGNTTSDVLQLLTKPFDIAFLDIEMAEDNIFSILSHTDHIHFDIVFVTAYERYALKAFNVDVLDYILKPLSQKVILNCYDKILRRLHPLNHIESIQSEGIVSQHPQKRIVLKQGDKVYVISCNDVIYLEAHGIYTNIYFNYNSKKTMVTISKSLSQLEVFYSYQDFYRVHRSFIINTTKIKNITRKDTLEVRMCTDDIIPIAKRRVTEFLTSIKI
jgi:two-component system LytT family response regulator